MLTTHAVLTARPSRRGRPRSDEQRLSEVDRYKRVRAAVLLRVRHWPAEVVAASLECSRATAYRWAAVGATYAEFGLARREALAG